MIGLETSRGSVARRAGGEWRECARTRWKGRSSREAPAPRNAGAGRSRPPSTPVTPSIRKDSHFDFTVEIQRAPVADQRRRVEIQRAPVADQRRCVEIQRAPVADQRRCVEIQRAPVADQRRCVGNSSGRRCGPTSLRRKVNGRPLRLEGRPSRIEQRPLQIDVGRRSLDRRGRRRFSAPGLCPSFPSAPLPRRVDFAACTVARRLGKTR